VSLAQNTFDGIIETLKNTFNDHLVCTDEVAQGFKRPSFRIQPVNSSSRRQIGNAHQITYTFDIIYHSCDEDGKSDCLQMQEKLYLLFKFMENRKLHGTNISKTMVDNDLHFIVDYTVHAREVTLDDSELFGDLDIRGDLKDD
jgi:hypothetical protein